MMDDGPLIPLRHVSITDESLDSIIYEYFALNAIYKVIRHDVLGRVLCKRRVDLDATIRSREEWFKRACEYESRMKLNDAISKAIFTPLARAA